METARPKVVEQDGKFHLAMVNCYGCAFAHHNKQFVLYSEALRFLESGNWKLKGRK